MKKISCTFLSFLGLLFSCKQKINLPTEASGKSLLWEITGNGLKQPSYFLGTMHLMCAEDAELSQSVKTLIAETNQVYFEVDLDNASELLRGFLILGKNKDINLNEVISPEAYERIKLFFEKNQPDIPFNVLEKQPPLLLSASLYEILLPCEKKNGVEMKIAEIAYKQKKQTKGLETVAFQASIFESIPYEEQAKDLVTSIDSLEKQTELMKEMLRIYKLQDVEKLSDLSLAEDSSIMNHADLMVYNRNQNWVMQFPKIASKATTLFAVGAAHLGGGKGVLNLLRKNGYTIRALKN